MPLSREQLLARQRGVTGSQIAVLAGLSPWGSPIEVWREKVTALDELPPQAPPSEDMMRGIHFEEPCMRWYADRTGRAVRLTGTIVHPERPLVIATPDGVSLSPDVPPERDEVNRRVVWHPDDVVVEVKCPSWRTAHSWGQEGSDRIPSYYYPQVIWEMAVTGLKRAHVVAYFGDMLRIYNLEWSQDIFDRLYEAAEKFWRDHVETKTPPSADGSKAYAEYLADLFPAPNSDLVEFDGVDEETARALAQARDAEEIIMAQSRRLEEAKNVLKSRIGIHRGMTGEFGRITWSKNRDSERVDWRAVAQEAGAANDLIAKHTTIHPGPRTFRATWRET